MSEFIRPSLTSHHLSIILRLLILIALAPITGCERRAGHPPSLEDVHADAAPKQESWDVRFSITETGRGEEDSRPRLTILAGHMATYETDSTYAVMQGSSDSLGGQVTAYLFDVAGDTSATVRADQLVLLEKGQVFEARGGVFVVTREEKTLESEHLRWDERERRVRTPGFVRIVTPQERIQGYALDADEDLDSYSLERITAQVPVEDDESE